MDAIRPIVNQYRGINAHLHSFWQGRGDWQEFHTSYIVFLANALKTALLPMGYTAGLAQSLQIQRYGEAAGRPKSDVTIYDMDAERARGHRTDSLSVMPVVTPILDMIDVDELDEYQAISIHPKSGQERGEAIVWIELLSPSNKPGGQDDDYYLKKRLKLIQSGMVFVEIDYLHETPPTFRKLPVYDNREIRISSEAQPYRIIVIEPRPTFRNGQVYIYPFAVDVPIPVVTIPLSGDDRLEFDFGDPYHKTIHDSAFAFEWVDYCQLPLNFDRYSLADQQRIVARMLAVLKAKQEGIDLETITPLPVEDISLEDGLKQLEMLTKV